ncbi:MAG: tyrosine-type recombinase/integrase, partial [Candidatus Aenigmarchaeota archaeon]|nr:tyrosine-type recombinase/integrase [Candidatus Aenigmarchaeota archaeon]
RIGGSGTEKVYYIVFKKDGKTYEEKVGRQYVDAMTQARAARIRAERIEGKRLSRKEIREKEKALKKAEHNRWTIDRLWEEYKRTGSNLKSLDREENSYKNHIMPFFGDKEPKDILALDIDRLRIKLSRAKKAPKTIAVALELLQRAINFGVKKRLTKGVDFTIEMPKVNNLKTEDLTPEQLTRLLKAIEEDTHPEAGAMMKMALFTGMRRGELFKLKWKDVDFQRGFINIRDPKGGSDQRIPLNDGARDLLESHLRTDSPYVFPGRDGKQRVNIKRQVNRIKEKAGLPKDFRPLHGLRHVYASMVASSGKVDMYTLQKLLTHKSPVMTQRYAHLRDEALKRAGNLAGEIIKETVKGKEEIAEVEDHKK